MKCAIISHIQYHLINNIKRNRRWHARYILVTVHYEGAGEVQLTFCRFTNNSKWTLIIGTDLRLSFQRTLELYTIRWNIKVMFKECKQHLNMGKCQSTTFDAQIASTTLSFAMYTMLTKYKEQNEYTTIGVLFDCLKDQLIQAVLAERLWALFLKLQQKIGKIFNLDLFDDYARLIKENALEESWILVTGPTPDIQNL